MVYTLYIQNIYGVYTMKDDKQVQMVIKLPKSLRDTFLEVCRDVDTTASQEIRSHMRKFIAKNGQKKLF